MAGGLRSGLEDEHHILIHLAARFQLAISPYTVQYTGMNKQKFGAYLREKREALLAQGRKDFTVRKLAKQIEIQPSYVSKVERCEVAPPSEQTIIRWARALGEDPDFVLAKAGKVSAEVRDIIIKHPALFADMLRRLRDMSEPELSNVVREIGNRYEPGPEE